MEKLFEIKTIYSLDEHIKFNFALLFRSRESLIAIILALLVMIYGLLWRTVYAISFALIYPLALVLVIYFSAKMNYKSNKAAQNEEITLEFYDNKIVQSTDIGTYTVEHDKIARIIETKTHFYIMISRNQGIIVPKKELPEELKNHIKSIKIN